MDMKKEYYPDTRAFAFADDIIHKHIASMMHCTGSYEPKDENELKDFMIDECAHILMDDFKKGEYTPLEFNDIRNAIAIRINGFFAIQVDDGDSAPESDVIASKGGMTCFSKSTIKREAYAVC